MPVSKRFLVWILYLYSVSIGKVRCAVGMPIALCCRGSNKQTGRKTFRVHRGGIAEKGKASMGRENAVPNS